MKHTFYFNTPFYISLAVFQIIKLKRINIPEELSIHSLTYFNHHSAAHQTNSPPTDAIQSPIAYAVSS